MDYSGLYDVDYCLDYVKHGGGGGHDEQHSSINGNLQVNKCPFLNTETQIKMYNIVGHCHMSVVHVFDEGRGC